MPFPKISQSVIYGIGFVLFSLASHAEISEIPLDLTSDGQWLLTTNEMRSGLNLRNALSGETRMVASTRGAGYYASFSNSDEYFCYKEILVDEKGLISCAPALYRLSSGETIRLASPSRLAGTPAVSKDGRIAFTSGNDLFVLDPGFQPILQLDLGYHVNLMAFSPGGNELAFADRDRQLVELNLKTRAVQILSDGEAEDLWGPEYSPEGGYLLFQSASGKIFIRRQADKTIRLMGEGMNPSWIEEGRIGWIRKTDNEREVIATELMTGDAEGKSVSVLKALKGDAEARFRGVHAAVVGSGEGALYRMNRGKWDVLPAPAARWREKTTLEALPALQADSFQETAALAQSGWVVLNGVPTIHQVYDTPNWFNGHWACGATAACMALTYYGLLDRWDVTVSSPYSHVSPYGRYICETYTYNGHTFNIAGNDPNGTPATGGYGYIIQNNWEETRTHMKEYISYHGPESAVDWSPTLTKARNEIDNEYPFVLLNSLTSSGHYITCVGYYPGQTTLVFNDPYGNKNTAGYPSFDGTRVSYDWPGYNNGYQNLNTVHCYIYARMDHPAEFRNALDNGGFEQDFDYWSKGGSTSYAILTSGAHGGSKACRFYRADGYATIWQDPGEAQGQLWRTTCYAYASSDTSNPEFGYKDQSGNTEASTPIHAGGWEYHSVEWVIGDDIDVQAWGYNSSQGMAIDDVRAGKASRMNWITDWCCCGPFPASLSTDHFAASGGEAALLPRPGLVQGGHSWEAYSRPDGFMNLDGFLASPASPSVVYAHIYVQSEQALNQVCLALGADDGIRVFLNGVSVFLDDTDGSHDYFAPDEEIVEGLRLNQGENRLTIKVRNAGGAFSFSARFCDSEGEALPD
jgi:hypothetical protein